MSEINGNAEPRAPENHPAADQSTAPAPGATIAPAFGTDMAMRALLHPRRIAIYGASTKPGFANNIQAGLKRSGYAGEVLPINPRYDAILGLPAYPALDATPDGADLAVIVLPNHLVMPALEDCARNGVGAVNIITSGYGERPGDTEGSARQRALIDFVARTGIRLVGPNCLGNISVPAKMLATSGPYPPLRPGPISLALQSGLLAYSIVLPLHDRGVGFTYVVTCGNEADLGVADFIRYYAADGHTRVIGCFVEQFRQPEKFLAAVDFAAERDIPVMVLKIGRSEGGRRAALAHTGSLVGADDIAAAVLRRHGVTRVTSLDDLNEALCLFHTGKRPRGSGVASAFVSGGAAGLVADLGADAGLSFPHLAPETQERLTRVIPPYGTVGNPLDYTGQAAQQPEILAGSLAALAEDPAIDTIVYGRAYPAKLDLATPIGEILERAVAAYPDTLFVVMSLVTGELKHAASPDVVPQRPVTTLDGIPFLQGTEASLKAIAALMRYAEFQRGRLATTRPSRAPSAAAARARALIAAANGAPMVEREAKRLLSLYDIAVPDERLATDADAAARAARELGYPVVLKIESPDLPHKSEAGGVLLGLTDEAAVRAGFQRVLASARAYKPDATVHGVLVQRQVSGGREVMLGMVRDPSFGPAIAVGLGGIFTETLGDTVLGIPPLSRQDARDMLAALRGAPILEGRAARGGSPSDLTAVAAVIERFSRLCVDVGDIVQAIDVNPVLVGAPGEGARAVDCLVVPG